MTTLDGAHAGTGRPTTTGPGTGPTERVRAAVVAGSVGMALVGSSAAMSARIAEQTLFTVQAVRYAAACAILLLLARARRVPVHRPRGREWGWLGGVCGSGLVVFNIAMVHGARHAEPAVLGVAVACVPLLLAVVAPLQAGQRPSRRVLVAAVLVTCGAAGVQGLGRSDAAGVGWAVVIFATEAGFTLLAVPVLGRHGAWGVSLHSTWMAAAGYGLLGVVLEGPGTITRLGTGQWLAVAYLAVAVTALAFLLWYSAVRRLGAGRAGLLTGVTPVAAALAGTALGAPAAGTGVWLGIGVVVGGLLLGLGSRGTQPVGG